MLNRKRLLSIAIVGIIVGIAYYLYTAIWSPNVKLTEPKTIYIEHQDDHNALVNKLQSEQLIIDKSSFELVSKLMKFNDLDITGLRWKPERIRKRIRTPIILLMEIEFGHPKSYLRKLDIHNKTWTSIMRDSTLKNILTTVGN